MRASWILGGLICLAVGLAFSLTLIGIIVGAPLMFIGFVIFIIGFFIPREKDRVEVHIHHHKK